VGNFKNIFPQALVFGKKKYPDTICACALFVLPLSETYRHGWRKAKIATQKKVFILCCVILMDLFIV
jgi:hypothetical protein